MKTLIVAAVLLLGMARAGAQQVNVGDSCYTLNWPSLYSNPDSILVDTCLSDSAHTVFFVKRGSEVEFAVKAISLLWAPSGTDLEVTWESIDTAYPTLRAAFDSIENKFGSFMLKKEFPEDTSSVASQSFYLIFNTYVLYDSISAAISAIEGVHYYFNWPVILFGVKDSHDKPIEESIYPNPAGNTLFVHLNGEFNPVSLEVFDALGRIVQKSSAFSGSADVRIDLSNLISGEYFLRFRNDRIPFIHVK